MRYTDKNTATQAGKADFTARNRMPTLFQFGIIGLVDFILVCAAYALSTSFVSFAIFTIISLSAMNVLMVWSVQGARDQILVTEFQNALYSAALSLNNQFCLIVRKDGVVVHTDTGFRTMYPSFERMEHRTIDDVLSLAHVSKEDCTRTFGVMYSGTAGQQLVTIRDSGGLHHKVMLYIDPIRRPEGYILIRGRMFVEVRGAS